MRAGWAQGVSSRGKTLVCLENEKSSPLATCVRHVGDDIAGPDQGQSRADGLFSRLVGYKVINRQGQSQADCIFSRLGLAGYKVIHSG